MRSNSMAVSLLVQAAKVFRVLRWPIVHDSSRDGPACDQYDGRDEPKGNGTKQRKVHRKGRRKYTVCLLPAIRILSGACDDPRAPCAMEKSYACNYACKSEERVNERLSDQRLARSVPGAVVQMDGSGGDS